MSHTPGPWEVDVGGTSTGRYYVVKVAGPYFDDGSEREIAQLETSEVRFSARSKNPRWKRKPEADEIEANARLIAAAPDLLTAAKSLLALIDEVPNDLRAAIAKAEGGAA